MLQEPMRSEPGEGGKGDGAKRQLLRVATEEFARNGFHGARIDVIAALTNTGKQTIYYHYESKFGLYAAVVAKILDSIRVFYAELRCEDFPPVEALRFFVSTTFDWYRDNEPLIRVVMDENINFGSSAAQMHGLRDLEEPALAALRSICERGVANGSIRADIDPMHLHLTISALCFYNVSNRYTVAATLDHDMRDDEAHRARRENVVEVIATYASWSQKALANDAAFPSPDIAVG